MPWRADEIIKQMYSDKGYLKISQAIDNEYLFSTKIIITAYVNLDIEIE